MDQEIVDQLSLESLPYYEEQLCQALQKIIELQDQINKEDAIEIENEILEDNNNDEVEINYEDLVQSIQQQQQNELEEIDQVSQQQQEQYKNLFDELHELEMTLNQTHQSTKINFEQQLLTEQQLQEKQLLLEQLSEQIQQQNQQNQEKEILIAKLQEFKPEVQKQSTPKKIKQSQNQTLNQQPILNQYENNQLEYINLMDYKHKLQQQIEQLQNKQVQKNDVQTQTSYNLQFSDLQQTKSENHTPFSSQIVMDTILEKQQKKNRDCQYCIIQ